MIQIRVPASSANLGPGFDSIGMAVNLYLTLQAEEAEDWSFVHHSTALQALPNDSSHFIAQMADDFCEKLNVPKIKCSVQMTSEIPLARGLGSSGTALIAALMLVDYYHNLKLSKEEMTRLLSEVEGHPDNVAASLLGGVITGYQSKEECFIQQLPPIEWPLYAFIPDIELKTSDARRVLPQSLDFGEAVAAGAIGNVLVAALAMKNYPLAGQMMMRDKYHEPYRSILLPHFDAVKSLGGYAFISGAGPTVLVMASPGSNFNDVSIDGVEVIKLEIDTAGAVLTEMTD